MRKCFYALPCILHCNTGDSRLKPLFRRPHASEGKSFCLGLMSLFLSQWRCCVWVWCHCFSASDDVVFGFDVIVSQPVTMMCVGLMSLFPSQWRCCVWVWCHCFSASDDVVCGCNDIMPVVGQTKCGMGKTSCCLLTVVHLGMHRDLFPIRRIKVWEAMRSETITLLGLAEGLICLCFCRRWWRLRISMSHWISFLGHHKNASTMEMSRGGFGCANYDVSDWSLAACYAKIQRLQ